MTQILTLKEVSSLLRRNRQTVVKKINEGKLKAKNVGGDKKPIYLIKAEWVEEYLNSK